MVRFVLVDLFLCCWKCFGKWSWLIGVFVSLECYFVVAGRTENRPGHLTEVYD